MWPSPSITRIAHSSVGAARLAPPPTPTPQPNKPGGRWLVDLLAGRFRRVAGLPVAALDRLGGFAGHLVVPGAQRVAEPGLVELQRPEPKLVPALAGVLH